MWQTCPHMLELNCNSSPHHMTLIKDHWTTWKGVKITFTVQPLWSKIGVKFFPLYISPSSGLFFISPDEDLLFEVETSWVKLLCKFQCWWSEKTCVSNVSKYTSKSSRWTFSINVPPLKKVKKIKTLCYFCRINFHCKIIWIKGTYRITEMLHTHVYLQ